MWSRVLQAGSLDGLFQGQPDRKAVITLEKIKTSLRETAGGSSGSPAEIKQQTPDGRLYRASPGANSLPIQKQASAKLTQVHSNLFASRGFWGHNLIRSLQNLYYSRDV